MRDNGAAIILGLSPTGLGVARSLAPRGVAVYGVDVRRYEVGHFSRLFRHDRRFSYLPAGEELLKALVAFGKESVVKPVIFNANDQYIDFVTKNRAALEPYFILTESMRPESNSVLLDKRAFFALCQQRDITIPMTFFPECEADAVAAANALRYPAIVKPTFGFQVRKLLHGRKLVEVANADELLAWWKRFDAWQAGVILQECIIGPEANIAVAGLYTNKHAECLSLFTGRKCRQYPPMYGTGAYMEACWLPDIAEMALQLVRELHFHGISDIEYKWDDRDQCWKLIEINPRPPLWVSLPRAAGVDIVWDAYCDLCGHANPPHIGQQNDKVCWQLFVRDMASSLYFMRHGQLSFSEFVRTALGQRNKEWAVCAWNDWGANFGYIVNTAMQIWLNFIAPPKKED